MRIAAYCRVSTEKTDQLNSLAAQKQFFEEYTARTGNTLTKLYADEGLSGTRIRNRRAFQQMMADAANQRFELVIVKDISRFARNTVDLLQSVRELKRLGIETQFLTANMTNMGNSEFVLTLFGALAQEESANTSKRVKFGKRINAEKGRVPNIVFGYEKKKGDYFHLEIHESEAAAVRQIFEWYTGEGIGTERIAKRLNMQGVLTKRGCRWNRTGVARVLANPLYIGRVTNGKEEVIDFLTGQRLPIAEERWLITDRPELRIIEPVVFERAQQLLQRRQAAWKQVHTGKTMQYLFSTMIRCAECGRFFRRCVRRNAAVRWRCAGHNENGQACANAVSISEQELMQTMQQYFLEILAVQKDAYCKWVEAMLRQCREEKQSADSLQRKAERERGKREKYLELYAAGLMEQSELKLRLQGIDAVLAALQQQTALQNSVIDLKRNICEAFPDLESISDAASITNLQLRRLVESITVDTSGMVRIRLQSVQRSVPFSSSGT